jgi:malonate transporter and related proteins
MTHILAVTSPFFCLVLLGWAVVRLGVLPLQAIPGLNGYVLFFALPCMLFRFSATTPIAQLLDASVVTVYLGCALAMVVLAVALARRAGVGWNDASFAALVAAFPNSGFMGVPLLVALLGEAAAAPAIVVLAIDMVVTTSLCIALSRLGAAGAGDARAAVVRALRGMVVNPLPWAILLGTLSSAFALVPPAPLMRTVEMLAVSASPVALFALGCMLARGQMVAAPAGASAAGELSRIVAGKLLLHPLLVLVAGRAAMALGLPLDPFAAAVLVLVAALPSASNVPILAERFRADAGLLARAVLVSTVGAFGSFTVAVAWVDVPALAPAAMRTTAATR